MPVSPCECNLILIDVFLYCCTVTAERKGDCPLQRIKDCVTETAAGLLVYGVYNGINFWENVERGMLSEYLLMALICKKRKR